MRTMSSRTRLTASGFTAVAFAVALAACGGTTVDGQAPEISSEQRTSTATSSSAFAQERPEKPTGPVPPPPSSAPEPLPGEPDPLPAPGAGSEPDPLPAPGGGDFVALLERRGVVMPGGVDPSATAAEACGRFDDGQQMDEVSGWVGERGGLDRDGQGYFLGAAVGTFCPENFPKLG